MTYILMKNYVAEPILVYDGPEPKKIMYKVESGCKVDLWAHANRGWENTVDKEVINYICSMIALPKKYLLDKEEYVSPIEDGPLYFVFCKNTEYLVCFSLFEKQPSRYQCYVLAILKKVRNGGNSA